MKNIFFILCSRPHEERQNKYFKKGDGIIVRGRMDSNKGNDGKTYWSLIAERHEFPLGRTTAQAGRGVPESGEPIEVEPPAELPF